MPVHVVAVDERTGGLELALAENLARHDLDPVEEAHGYQRLRDAGLTKKGIAQRLGLAQRRITERLDVLKLTETLHPQIAAGAIPPAAVKTLVRLHAIHPALPEVVAARVAAGPAQAWMEPLTWPQVIADPIAALMHDATRPGTELPADVFDAADSYPLDRFTLSDAAAAQAAELCELLGIERAQFEVRFGREMVEQAIALKAAYASREGWHHLIAGQDVADQLAGDYIAACLANQRAIAERTSASRTAAGDDHHGDQAALPSDEEVKAQRRAERAAEQQARRTAHAHNTQLGVAVVKSLTRVKVDAAILKVLTTVDVAGELALIAARGARYGLPGWTEEVTQKNGKIRIEYLDSGQAAAKAREFLALASSPGEIAGRLLCLIAMARYADEQAVARSHRVARSLPIAGGLPWSDETTELVDELCAQRLPDHLTAAVREHAAAEREAGREREAQIATARQRLEGIEQRAGDLDDQQRAKALADIQTVFGRYSTDGFRLSRLIQQASHADEAGQDEPIDERTAAA